VSPMRFMLWTAALVAGLWVLVAGPAYLWAGGRGLAGSAAAAGICLATQVLGYLGQRWALEKGSLALMGVHFGGMLVRMTLVLTVVAVLVGYGIFDFASFVVWVILFYLVLLGVETYQLHRLLQGRR